MSALRVDVDRAACVGSRWCTTIAVDAFGIGDDGKAQVLAPDRSTDEELREAEDSCPVSAILVDEGEDPQT